MIDTNETSLCTWLHEAPLPFCNAALGCTHSCTRPSALRLLHETSQAKIVDHILDLLDSILDPIRPLPEGVVLQIEDLEAGVEVFDKVRYCQRASVVAECHAVSCQTSLQAVSQFNGVWVERVVLPSHRQD